MGRGFRAFMDHSVHLRRQTTLAVVFTAASLSGCASMGMDGATRADAARALGLSPADLVIVSREYDIPASGGVEYTLANYTVHTDSGLTYTCDLDTSSAPTISPHRTVCKRKP